MKNGDISDNKLFHKVLISAFLVLITLKIILGENYET